MMEPKSGICLKYLKENVAELCDNGEQFTAQDSALVSDQKAEVTDFCGENGLTATET